MSATPPLFKINEQSEFNLGAESWIELSANAANANFSPDRVTPLPFTSGEEYLKMLREAQKESKESSRVVSLSSSRRDSPKGSPKSPPNSPNPELTNEEELKGIYINYWTAKDKAATIASSTTTTTSHDKDWVWEWSSRPDQQPPKDWRFEHPIKKEMPKFSMRLARVGKNSLFSREVLYSLVITNVLSLLLGAGVGIWLSRRGFFFTRVSIE